MRQLSSAVRWTTTIAALTTGGGVAQVVECGPGGVLTGLVKRIERRRDTQTFSIEEPESFNAALAAVSA